MNAPLRRPGEAILDRYCPDLSTTEREAALERLHGLARLLIRIAKRLDMEGAVPTEDSRKTKAHGKIRSLPSQV